MAFVLADRVKESCAAPGTGTVTLLGAATGYQSFSAGIGANNTTYYTIADQGGANWEVGYGTIGAGGTTLARTTVLASSNSGSLVNFSNGTQDVFCDYPAGKAANLDSNSKVSFGGNSYEDFASISAPAYSEGRVWYDSTAHSLTYYNDSANSIVHIGQDIQVKVINNTGSSIPNGSPVYITSTSSGQTYPNVALAKADVAATSAVIGLTNGAIANGSIGYVTSQGGIDNVNTSAFTVGQVLYLSPYSAGQLMNTIPPTGITVQVGVVSYVNSSTGKIYVKQTTPLAVPASIITGTLGVENGGTGATTLTGYVKGNGTSAFTASSTIPTTDLSGTVTNAQLANSAITINGTSTSLGGSISVGTVTSVTGTSPVVSSGGATPAISMPAATTSVSGYLTSTDWNTFNSKAAPFTYTTSYIPYGQGTTTPNQSSGLQYNGSYLLVGTTAVLGGLTNPISAATGSTNNYIQKYIYNANNGTSASSDIVAYTNNSTDAHGWADLGFTSQSYADSVYTVTGPNEAYLFGSAPSGSGKTGNLVYATDSTGTENVHQFYVGGFTQAKSAWKAKIDANGLSATQINATNGLVVNSNTVSASYTIPTGSSASSVGPMTVASGQSVTVSSGSRWVVL